MKVMLDADSCIYLINRRKGMGRSPMPAQVKVTLSNFWMLRLRAA